MTNQECVNELVNYWDSDDYESNFLQNKYEKDFMEYSIVRDEKYLLEVDDFSIFATGINEYNERILWYSVECAHQKYEGSPSFTICSKCSNTVYDDFRNGVIGYHDLLKCDDVDSVWVGADDRGIIDCFPITYSQIKKEYIISNDFRLRSKVS